MRRLVPLIVLAAAAVAACATDPGVATQGARQSPTETGEPPATTATTPVTTAPETSAPPSTAPPATERPASTTPATPPPTVPELFNFGDAKPPRPYDAFLQAALTDVQRWWTEIYPELYGEPFRPLAGGIYAAYPERADPIPGCGFDPETTYEEVHQFAAFYCTFSDFIAYDDGEDGVLFDLADEFGPTILGVVIAHEYGHAVQSRAGIIEAGHPTIVTEQQADCFAGAWVDRAASGEAPGVTFTDADIRTGLIAMITVRDPVGIDQLTPGGHGSAFDRVGAFQVGFTEGPQRCVELIEDPLPLAPNEFVPGSRDERNQGNLPFGYDDGQIVDLVVDDLNAFWPEAVAAEGGELAPLTVTPVDAASDIECAELAGDLGLGAALCPSTGVVFLDEPRALELHGEVGDFSVGYVLGTAWAEAVQRALDSPLTGEERALADDCLVGGWTSTLVPTASGTARGPQISPGDLDEAIRTALVSGDESATTDVRGSSFEKIASFRDGVLEGLDTCWARLD